MPIPLHFFYCGLRVHKIGILKSCTSLQKKRQYRSSIVYVVARDETLSFESSCVGSVNNLLVGIRSNEATHFKHVAVSLSDPRWVWLNVSGNQKKKIFANASNCVLNFRRYLVITFSWNFALDHKMVHKLSTAPVNVSEWPNASTTLFAVL